LTANATDSATEGLLSSRLVMVTGKGGTGKTTFAAALAVLAAARGRRTLLCEIDNQRPSMTAIFGKAPRNAPQKVRDGLDVCNIEWEPALESFLEALVPSRRIVKLILGNQIVSRFLDFTPGSQELVELSALAHHIEQYDTVIVDMPASGHAFSLLDITRSAMGLFRSGPVRRRAAELRELLVAPSTRVVFVALPEEMVVNETLETLQRMRSFELIGGEPVVYLNRATLPTLTDDERGVIAKLTDLALSPAQEEFVRAGRWEDVLEQGTALSQQRLSDGVTIDPVLVGPAPPGGSGRDVVLDVAATLGRGVGLTRRDLTWT
jgi:anion-transporting  ArsA/GET3 family ATPase